MINQNCLQTSKLFKNQAETTQQSRIQMLTKSDGGLIGQAWYSLREAWFGRNADRLIVIDYKKLASEPQATLSQLYGELGETPYQHNFDEVVYDERDYDLGIGLGQLHTVRRKVEYQPRRPDIDEGVFREYERWSFWRTNAPRPGCVVIM
jgi:sulfotransferase